jgi:tRNA U54 and U55 pseudouridine synthase Pus10
MSPELLPPERSDGGRLFLLHLVASAGTYIKEFVHGDRGRTRPHVGMLLVGVVGEPLR